VDGVATTLYTGTITYGALYNASRLLRLNDGEKPDVIRDRDDTLEQFLRAFNWDGKELKLAFETDFRAAKLGRPHHMKFTARPAPAASTAAR